jgi:hypothetical protein
MDKKPLTTSAGIPVGDNQNSLTAGPRGPLLVQDWQLSFPRRPCPVLRILHSSPGRQDAAIPIQPESGPLPGAGGLPALRTRSSCDREKQIAITSLSK